MPPERLATGNRAQLDLIDVVQTNGPASEFDRHQRQIAPVLLVGVEGAAGEDTLAALLGGGATVMAVAARVPDYSRPNLTWLQYDLSRERACVESTIMISASADSLGPALRQASTMPTLRRIVALSSAEMLFDRHTAESKRRRIDKLVSHEEQLRDLCLRRGITLSLIRPTLIYGSNAHASIDGIGEWLARRGWFPIAGRGLRQPVHAGDIAALMARLAARPVEGTFEIGGERLAYPDLVRRIASASGREVRLIRGPAGLFVFALRSAQRIGRLREVDPAALGLQQIDQVVDDTAARQQVAWTPRNFHPQPYR